MGLEERDGRDNVVMQNHDLKKYHYAALVSHTGAISPLCAKVPRRLNLNRELWTLRKEAVTCERCAQALKDVAKPVDKGTGSGESITHEKEMP
mgnify:CR=1 FL=1